MEYRFDKTARGEKYFVDTILAFLLMAQEFRGLQILFNYIFGNDFCNNNSKDYEIVSELDAVRDGATYNDEVELIFNECGRIAVPDLFLRWDNVCIVIEAKFFQDPSLSKLNNQIKLQREAIERVKKYTLYKDMNIHHVVITIKHKSNLRDSISITWDRVLSLIEDSDIKNTDEIVYCIKVLHDAVLRAKQELNKDDYKWERLKYDKLIEQLPRLVTEGKVYIGFEGGVKKLNTASIEDLKKRSHYKVAHIQNIKLSKDWIKLNEFLGRIFDLQHFSANYEETGL